MNSYDYDPGENGMFYKTYLKKKISLNMNDVSLEKALRVVAQKAGLRLTYRKDRITEKTVTVNKSRISVSDALQLLLKGTGLDYMFSRDSHLVINSARQQFEQSMAQVEGTVTDAETGDPLPGVNIVIKGTTTGTSTNTNGHFELTVSSLSDTLIFSFIGYQNREVPLNGRSNLNIALSPAAISGEELVVVGYGSAQKKDLTGAVGTIGSEDISSKGTTNPISALQGQVAGVDISANTGLPGSSFDIDIRGVNSLSGGDPLYVVDGVMTNNIDFLNSNQIKRIDILKDASATAIYGSRGSNGVVLVTTKSGEMQGEPRFNYSSHVGIRTIANMPDFVNAEEGITYTKNRGITEKLVQGESLNAPDNLFGFPTGEDHDYWMNVIENENYTDWVDLMMRPGIQTNHFLSATGGTESLSYLIGAGILSDNGNIEGQKYNKYNFKANIDADVSDKWAMGANINLSYTDKDWMSERIMQQIFRMPEWTPAFNEDGEMIQIPMKGISGNVSPLAESKYNVYETRENYVISNFYLQFDPVPWITLKSTFSPNVRIGQVGYYWDKLAYGGQAGGQMTKTQDFSYVWDNQLSAIQEFGDHRFDYDFIYSMQMDRNNSLFGFGWDLPFNSEFYNLGSATYPAVSSDYRKTSLMSLTNRLNYSYKDRYLFTATGRWDGSSKLAPGNKWAFFPSAAVAWRISEERAIQNIPAISNLKLRLSYGHTGNDNINPYSTQFSVDQQTYYDWNGSVATGFRPNSISNKELTWERTREWNLGLDFGFLRNRITSEFNVYDKLSKSLLLSRKLAVPTGWGSMNDNIGSLSNKGLEIQLRTVNIQTNDFRWQTNFTFSTNENEIVELYGGKEDDVANRWFIGEPVNVVYAAVFDGIWQKDELDPGQRQELEGTAKVKDLNGDGKIDVDNDMKVLGSPQPKWTGSFSTTFNYKNWDLSATLYTKQGVFLFSDFHQEFTDFNSKQILDVPYYMRENPHTEARYSNTYPQPAYQGQYWGEDAEDYGYPGFNKDASFVRLKNITLGYNMSTSLLDKIGIRKMRLYANVLNPFVWTKYDGFDPEWAGAGISGSVSNSTSFRVFQFGTNITF
ncbi:SusC/RagA family TonB-linked outer membrane protein [Aliifodinibius sp. S!AR15-10]|uniref:SusC/RagA family TonB-linked outer membrane protein n=1 Tax=Aliifodinibius sp. S!AR15-10 TaxID=2950437 RepID=UPI00286FD0AC|nr:SusC/RagA family TonB-linked outer membrane protein [Aliifodinibius sp. S!AR15-10]